MNIIIDTSTLWKDRGFLKSDILLLKKLSKLELLKIHIPWIVYKESTSQNLIDVKSGINKAIRELSNLNNKGLHHDDYKKLQQITKELEKLKFEADQSTKRHWEKFITESKANLHELDKKHGEKVMTAYFLGAKPFPKPKSRKDIPDAFIYEATKSISEKFGEIHFICADNNLRESIGTYQNCKVFDSYDDFYNSDGFKKVYSKYEKIEHFADELMILSDNIDKIEEYAKKELYGDLFAGEEQLIIHENIPSEGNEGALQAIDDETIEKIKIEKIQFVDGIFYIPVEIKANFLIEYFLFKSEYCIYSDCRQISIIEPDWNEHVYLVQEQFIVKISFKCIIQQKSIMQRDFKFKSEPAVIEELETIECNQ